MSYAVTLLRVCYCINKYTPLILGMVETKRVVHLWRHVILGNFWPLLPIVMLFRKKGFFLSSQNPRTPWALRFSYEQLPIAHGWKKVVHKECHFLKWNRLDHWNVSNHTLCVTSLMNRSICLNNFSAILLEIYVNF